MGNVQIVQQRPYRSIPTHELLAIVMNEFGPTLNTIEKMRRERNFGDGAREYLCQLMKDVEQKIHSFNQDMVGKSQFPDRRQKDVVTIQHLQQEVSRLRDKNDALEKQNSSLNKLLQDTLNKIQSEKISGPSKRASMPVGMAVKEPKTSDVNARSSSSGIGRGSNDQLVNDLQYQLGKRDDEITTLKASNESGQSYIKHLSEKIKELENENKKLYAEKENLALRLSKMAGDRLIDNNPAIADLSDPNRPTKLGEVYSELYDNEWTNAFEKLQKSGYEERIVVDTLQLTLQNVFKFCEMKAGMVLKKSTDAVNLLFEEYKRSVSALVPDHLTVLHKSGSVTAEEIKLQQRWKPKSLQSNTEESESKQMLMSTGMGEKKERLKKTAECKLIQLRKEVAVSMVPIVQEAYMEASWDPECLEELKTFILKCLYLGWMMVVQSPPMVLATCEAEEKFDKNKFKEYTKSGDVVDFLVWPALLLEKDGPVVVKGVAETKGK